MKNLLTIFVLGFSSFAFAQQTSKAEMLDGFGSFNCEIFLATMDVFYTQLNNSPTTKGYLVVSGDRSTLRMKLVAELLVESAVKARNFDRSRVEVVHGQEAGALNVRMWLVPVGVDKPNFQESSWNLTFDKNDEPLVLDSEMTQICPSASFETVAKGLLQANQTGMIYVIVHGNDAGERMRQLSAARRRLGKVDPQRSRFFLRHSPIGYSDFYFAVGNRSRLEFKSSF